MKFIYMYIYICIYYIYIFIYLYNITFDSTIYVYVYMFVNAERHWLCVLHMYVYVQYKYISPIRAYPASNIYSCRAWKMKIDDVFHHRVQRVHFRCNCSAFKHKCRRKVQSESTVNNSEWVFESQCECVRQLIISVKWSTRNAAKAQLQLASLPARSQVGFGQAKTVANLPLYSLIYMYIIKP